ncbi:AAA family ATPase [Salibacterium halotolerans]|uniref:Nuclease SbcCD subunit C n=1 Tax=Salibacterium halotolerans TaxID=1884432 RepID=A0A1I5QEI7_9BACI|nr:SMC family ATPase [Salibacterium halotolerans]SFP44675.1 exonuclease SbcC [Salibacterium halotolerans]
MRPLELSLKGLHSFREKQTVDFTDLTEEGIFGIFGPTGSGKSSILDAMTLALYGNVERAPNNTNGIINQAEDELYVSFTFQLGNGADHSVLKVERTYKRSGGHHVKTASARLHDLTGDPSVLADKASDVNKEVEKRLGLSIDDFTRAVVLPQGKFSDFLTLRGNDRRVMLQRIFQLEKYGDQLIKKVKAGLQDAEHGREKIESEQQGLGVDAAALKRAEQETAYWDEQLQSVLTTREVLEEQWNYGRQLREWEQEWKKSTQNIEELLVKKPSIDQQRRQLALSEKAEMLVPYADSVMDAAAEKQTWTAEEEKTRIRRDQARAQYENASGEMETFKEEKKQADERLRRRENEVDKAEELKQQMTEAEKEQESLLKQKTDIDKRLDTHQAEQEQIEKDLKRYEEAVCRFQSELDELDKTMEDAYLLMEAKDRKQHIMQLEHQYETARLEKEEENKRELSLSGTLKEKNNQAVHAGNQLQERTRQLLYWYNKCSDERQWLERTIHRLGKWSESCRIEADHIQKQAAAAGLASQLTAGEACPVCGSVHHPDPEQEGNPDKDLQPLLEQKNNFDDWIQCLKTMEMECRNRQRVLEQLSEQTTGMVLTPVHHRDTVQRPDADWFLPDIEHNEDWEQHLQKKITEWEREEDTIDYIQRDMDNKKKQIQQLAVEQRELYHQWNSSRSSLKKKLEQAHALKKQIEEKKKEWQKTYPRFDFETVEEKQRRRMQQDEQKQMLQKRVEDGTSHVQSQQQKLTEKRNDIHAVTVEQKETDTKLEQVSSTIRQHKQQLFEWLQDETVQNARDELEREKKAWLDQEEQLSGRLEEAGTEKEKAENAHSIALHALQEAQKREKSSTEKWNEQSTRYEELPDEPSRVKEYVLSGDQKRDMEISIKNHDQSLDYWRKAKEELEPKIAGQTISDEAWQRLDHARTSAMELVDDTRERRAAAHETRKTMEQKKERYEALEKERRDWEQQAEKYRRLDQVFRGKGFIDFLAEEQLEQVTRTASEWLRQLTRGRYTVELDDQGGFIIRDETNAGLTRPVSSLSGGETFLTSLALALALSSSIQLKGRYPLEFFFLDEGFGTLDQELLDTVMTALEKLQMNNLAVGIISHVPDIQERLLHKLIVKEAEPGGKGSSIEKI